MRWRGLALALLLASPAAAAAPDPVLRLQHQGIARHAILDRPPGSRPPLPLVIALHGLDRDFATAEEIWRFFGGSLPHC